MNGGGKDQTTAEGAHKRRNESSNPRIPCPLLSLISRPDLAPLRGAGGGNARRAGVARGGRPHDRYVVPFASPSELIDDNWLQSTYAQMNVF